MPGGARGCGLQDKTNVTRFYRRIGDWSAGLLVRGSSFGSQTALAVQTDGSAVGTWRVAHNARGLCRCTATFAAFCWLVADLWRVDDQRAAATEAHWLRCGLESTSG